MFYHVDLAIAAAIQLPCAYMRTCVYKYVKLTASATHHLKDYPNESVFGGNKQVGKQ